MSSATAALPGIRASANGPGRESLSAIAAMAWADLMERTRRPGHLVALLVMAWLTHGMMPPQAAGYRTFTMIDGYRPAYGSAFVGTLVALLTGTYFLFVGFYLVRGGVERDRRNGVGEVLAATRVSRLGYLASKVLSNVGVLGSMMLVAMLVAVASQQLLGEDRHLDVVAIALPFFVLTAPVVVFVAAAAVSFDCLPVLRRGIGNVAWFFLLCAILAASSSEDPRRQSPYVDLVGGRTVASAAFEDLVIAFPDAPRSERSLSMGLNVSPEWKGKLVQTFHWKGMAWSPAVLLSRLLWLGVAVLLMLVASRAFDRFEAGRASPGAVRTSRLGWIERSLHRLAPSTAPAVVRAAMLTTAPRTFAFANLLLAELTLIAKGMPSWWYVGAAGLVIAECFAPLGAVRAGLLPIAAFWPVFAWSTLGTRERQFDTAGVFFSVARPVARMLPASALAGAIVMLLIGAPAGLRLVLAGETAAASGWALGAFTVSGLALACGIWSGNSKLFEVLYLFLWYIGPMHHLAELDFTGVTVARSNGLWITYAVITLVLFTLAWIGRTRQVRS